MARISAQISLYPLRVEHLSPFVEEVLELFDRHPIEVRPGPMSTVIVGDEAEIFGALREAFGKASERADVVMSVTLSNACPVCID